MIQTLLTVCLPLSLLSRHTRDIKVLENLSSETNFLIFSREEFFYMIHLKFSFLTKSTKYTLTQYTYTHTFRQQNFLMTTKVCSNKETKNDNHTVYLERQSTLDANI